MGIFDFMKGAGEKIFQPGEARREAAIEKHLKSQGIDFANVKVDVDDSTVVLEGWVQDQADREKAVLLAGNVDGIEKVDDRLTVIRSGAAATPAAAPAAAKAPGAGATVAQSSAGSQTGWESRTYTVKPGDTLSGISKDVYGDAGKYQKIFEANQPMLKDPDRIYPGQVLRIPQA